MGKVILVGNLGRDPELRFTKDGRPVASFSIATTDRWRDQQGSQQERTEWHRIVVWGKQGENCAQYLQKGRSVYIDGRLQTREWEDRDGNKRWTTEVVAQSVQFLGPRGEGASRAPASDSSGSTSPSEDAGSGAGAGAGPGPESGQGDDIPF